MTLLFYTKGQVAEKRKEKNKEERSGPKEGSLPSRLRQVKGELWLGFLPYNEYYHYRLYIFVNYLN